MVCLSFNVHQIIEIIKSDWLYFSSAQREHDISVPRMHIKSLYGVVNIFRRGVCSTLLYYTI